MGYFPASKWRAHRLNIGAPRTATRVRDTIKSVVVFCENAEFKTDFPDGVVHIGELVDYLKQHTAAVIAPERMQLAFGRLEMARLALSGQTDVEHVESLRRRLGGGTG